MNRLMVCLLFTAAALAEQPGIPKKPACNAASRGRFWPAAANTDPKVMRRLAQCGNLEFCQLSLWRYKWKRATVNIRQMGKTPLAPSAECIALLHELATRELAASSEETTLR